MESNYEFFESDRKAIWIKTIARIVQRSAQGNYTNIAYIAAETLDYLSYSANQAFDIMIDSFPQSVIENPVWLYCWNEKGSRPEFPRQLEMVRLLNRDGLRVFVDKQRNEWQHARLMSPDECSYAGCKFVGV